MKVRIILYLLIALIILIVTPVFLFLYFQYGSKASSSKANLVIDTKRIVGPVIPNWKALAQGGEEPGVRMFQNVTGQMAELAPTYVRLDHLYDFYNVVSRDGGNLSFNWQNLDATVCDILATGAKPFLSLGYMPSVISEDGTVIGKPKNWGEWSLVVQKTIEHYSGVNTRICNGQASGMSNIYYEVWNEPDLESFGSFKYYGSKNYLDLYKYAAYGAAAAQNVYPFYLGGPATTALYKNWVMTLINFVKNNKLRLDFISWHHYTTKPEDYTKDLMSLTDDWLKSVDPDYRNIPLIISEWGYDASYNPMADTDGGAAYTIDSIRSFTYVNHEGQLVNSLNMGFSFEVKDGPTPRWGILSYTGYKKPRFYALRFLNLLQGYQLLVGGEGTFVHAIASFNPLTNTITVALVNYDPAGKNEELVPLTFTNIPQGNYQMTMHYTSGNTVTFKDLKTTIDPETGGFKLRNDGILMKPNMVIGLQLQKL